MIDFYAETTFMFVCPVQVDRLNVPNESLHYSGIDYAG